MNYAQELLSLCDLKEELEQVLVAEVSDSVNSSSLRQNLNKVEEYIGEGDWDRALLFANMLSEDAGKLIDEIGKRKK